MNYYKLLKDEVKQMIKDNKQLQEEDYSKIKTHLNVTEKALNFINNYLDLRFENALKQYNSDKKKAYDEFMAKKFMEYLNIYTEELYLLDKEKTDEQLTYRKQLRSIINYLWDVINNNS